MARQGGSRASSLDGVEGWLQAHRYRQNVSAIAVCPAAAVFDNFRSYGTEPAVGSAIKKSGVPRSEIFLTTKLWNNKHHPEDVEGALDASLKDLGTDYVDLFLMHWPSPFARSEESFPKESDGKTNAKGDTDYVDTYKAMEKLLKTGKTKAIGVSNFSQAEMERLLKETSVVSVVSNAITRPLTVP